MDWDSYFGSPSQAPSSQQAPPPDWDNYFSVPKEPDWRDREAEETLSAMQAPEVRGTILPLSLDPQTGKRSLAVPGAVYDPATLPGDVYTGKLNPRSQEGIERAVGFGGLVAAGPRMAARSPSKSAAPTPNLKTVPTTAEIKDFSRQLYKEAEEAGVAVNSAAFNRLAYGIRHMAKKERMARDFHPQSYSAAEGLYADRVVKVAKNPMSPMTKVEPKQADRTYSLEDIDYHRRRAGLAARGHDPKYADDRRIASQISDRIDEWWSSLGPKDIASGDLAKAQSAIAGARPLWARMRKAEMLDAVQERALNAVGANYTNAGMQTALRQQFKSIANNPKSMSKFTKEEQTVIKQITRGATAENMLRWAGKFSPSSPMSAIIAMFTGHMAGGPMGAAALMGGGAIAAKASAKMGAKKVDRLNALVRRGYADDAAY
jgi:hypothetical protein